MTPIKMPVSAGNTVRSSAGDATGASSAQGALSFGDLLRSHSLATDGNAAPAETPVILEPLLEDSSVGEPADQEPVPLEQLAELLKSGQQPPPLPQLTGVAAGVQRLPAEPIDPASDASMMSGKEFAFTLLKPLEGGELPALPQIAEQLREAIRGKIFQTPLASGDALRVLQADDEATETAGNLLTTGKGLPSPALFALMVREGGQANSTLAQNQVPAPVIAGQMQLDQVQIDPAMAGLEVMASEILPEPAIRAGSTPLSASESPGPGIGLPAPARVDSLSPITTPVAPELSLSIHQKNWSQALGQQLVWMAQHHAQQAEIKVNPAHLGPIEVHLSLNQDQASVNFFAHEAAVRDVLENALPRLREMLSNQGLQLNQASVSDQSLAQQHQQSNGRSSPQREGWLEQADAELDSEDNRWQPIEDRPGGVDHYI